MNAATIVAIVIGIVNLFALGVVAWQTYLTRKSVHLAQQNLQIEQDIMEINNLPESGSIIWVQTWLGRWREELEEIISDEAKIRNKILSGEQGLGKKYGLDTPKGIIIKPIYTGLPGWLKAITMAAAQYYYSGKSTASNLSGHDADFTLKLLPDILDECKSDVIEINKMQALIEKKVPDWYLHSPARIQDDKFFDR